jgi:Polyketide cyclase / dehydrase and lipid transport
MRIDAGRLLLLSLTVVLMTMKPVGAATVPNLEVTRDKGTYAVTFDVLLTAEAAKVRELLSDYTRWSRLSETVRESRVVETFPGGWQRVSLDVQACVLIFCKTVRQIKDLIERPNGDLYAVMVPEHSDFTAGWECWRIVAEGSKTRVQYHAALVPGSRALPLLGRWVVASNLRRTLMEAANNLEVLATASTGQMAFQGE